MCTWWSALCNDPAVTTTRDQSDTERDEPSGNLTEAQLAARYGKHVRTVVRWRRLGLSPPWFKDPGGTVWYRLETVREWEAANEVTTETRATA